MFKELFTKLTESQDWEKEDFEKGLVKIKKSKHYSKQYEILNDKIIFYFKDFNGANRLQNKLSDYLLNCGVTEIKASRKNIKDTEGTFIIYLPSDGSDKNCVLDSVKKVMGGPIKESDNSIRKMMGGSFNIYEDDNYNGVKEVFSLLSTEPWVGYSTIYEKSPINPNMYGFIEPNFSFNNKKKYQEIIKKSLKKLSMYNFKKVTDTPDSKHYVDKDLDVRIIFDYLDDTDEISIYIFKNSKMKKRK